MYLETMFHCRGAVSRFIRAILDRKHFRARPTLAQHHSRQRGSRSAQKIPGRISLCKGGWKMMVVKNCVGVGNDGGEKLCGFWCTDTSVFHHPFFAAYLRCLGTPFFHRIFTSFSLFFSLLDSPWYFLSSPGAPLDRKKRLISKQIDLFSIFCF